MSGLFYFQASEAVSSHKKGLGNPAHKLQSSSKKFEAPGKWVGG